MDLSVKPEEATGRIPKEAPIPEAIKSDLDRLKDTPKSQDDAIIDLLDLDETEIDLADVADLADLILPWWNQHLVVEPSHPAEAHRPLGPEHDLAASLCQVLSREVGNDYTIRLDGRRYR